MASDGTVAARLFVEVGARGLAETSAGLATMGANVSGVQSGLMGLAKGLGGIYAVKTAFDATIGSAIEWESEFAGVRKTVDATDKQLASLEDELLSMNRTMPVSRSELAGIAEAAGALGIESKSIGEFTETVAMIGETTNVSSEMAANALGKLSNVLGLTEADFDNFGAALVDLGNKGASTEQEILGIAERAGAGAALIDIAADATLGWSAAVANLGIEAEAGGSALQRFFLGMTTHVAEAGAELDAIAETAGMTAGAFAQAFGQDASSALEAFIVGMEDLSQAEQLALLEMLKFGDVRITRTLLGLAGNVDNLNDSLDIGADAWGENTALVDEYGKRVETTASRVDTLINRLGQLAMIQGERGQGPVDFFLGIGEAVAGLGEATNAAISNLERIQARAMELRETTGMSLSEALAQAKAEPEFFGENANETSRNLRDMFADGARGASQAFDENFEISESVAKEAAEAREAFISGLPTPGDIAGSLRPAIEDYDTALQEIADMAANSATDAEESAKIIGVLTAQGIVAGMESESTRTQSATLELVNDVLSDFETLRPGVLQLGRDVPADLQAGMEEILPEVQEWLKIHGKGETLESLTLDEAYELGVGGVYLWWMGMQAESGAAKAEADRIALMIETSLNMSGYTWGAHLGQTFAAGIAAQGFTVEQAALALAGYAAAPIAFSEPPSFGPLSDIDEFGIHMAQRYADSIERGYSIVEDAALGLAGAAVPMLDNLGPDVSATGPAALGSSEGQGRNITINVNVSGDLRARDAEEVADVLNRALWVSGVNG